MKLTLKKARELALREFGTAKGIQREENALPDCYIMRLGMDAFQLGAHLLHKEGVIRAVGRLVLGGQDELAANEAIRMVVQRGQRTIA